MRVEKMRNGRMRSKLASIQEKKKERRCDLHFWCTYIGVYWVLYLLCNSVIGDHGLEQRKFYIHFIPFQSITLFYFISMN